LTTLDQRRALALRIAKTIQRDPASIVASLRARLDTTAFDFNKRQPRDDHGRWTDKPGSGLGKLIKKAVSRFSPSDQEEYDKLESKLGKTGHLRGKEAERHNALRKKLHGSPSPSYDTEDEGPTHADNVARQHQLERQFESDEGLSSAEHDELKGLQSLAKDASDSDIAEFKRLENKLDNSYLTDAENARHNELRRKIEGPQRARERELDDIAENRGFITEDEHQSSKSKGVTSHSFNDDETSMLMDAIGGYSSYLSDIFNVENQEDDTENRNMYESIDQKLRGDDTGKPFTKDEMYYIEGAIDHVIEDAEDEYGEDEDGNSHDYELSSLARKIYELNAGLHR
jgi:hypothetical protein